MDSKTIRMAISRTTGVIFTVGALALTMAGANAQVVSTSYGNLPAGATPINLSPSAPYTLNPFNTNTQNYSVFGGTNGNPYGGIGSAALYGVGGYSGLGDFGVYDISGSALSGFASTPFGGGLNFLGDNFGGGYATFGPNGSIEVTPGPGYAAYLDAYNQYLHNQAIQAANHRSANSANTNSSMDGNIANNGAPMPLSQAVTLQRGSHFDVTVGWRGDPNVVSRMTVTLLNRYHLPLSQQVADGASPAYFAANKDTFAARYYRVDVLYTDGAAATVILPLRSSNR